MLYNVYTTLLAVVSVPILYWTGLLVKRIIYIARCRHRVAKLPGMPLLPIIGDLHHVSLGNLTLEESTLQWLKIYHKHIFGDYLLLSYL